MALFFTAVATVGGIVFWVHRMVTKSQKEALEANRKEIRSLADHFQKAEERRQADAQELRSRIEDLRSEIKGVEASLRGEIKSVERGMAEGHRDLSQQVQANAAAVNQVTGEIRHIPRIEQRQAQQERELGWLTRSVRSEHMPPRAADTGSRHEASEPTRIAAQSTPPDQGDN